MARKYDIRRIRVATSYSIADIAEQLGTHPNTIRCWLKRGLKPIDNTLPALIHGSALKAFLVTMQSSSTVKCSSGELYCFKCRQPQRPAPATVRITTRSSRLLAIEGQCGICGTKMHRGGSMSRLSEYLAEFPQFARQSQRLTELENDLCNCESEPEFQDA